MSINKVGVVGWPIDHSLSPIMHNAAFKALGMHDWFYDKMAVPPDIASHAIKEPKRHGYIGLNVTVPFKEKALTLTNPDEIARAVGAVNTIDFRDDTGTNTDVDGFIDDLKAHDVTLSNQRALVLGAGGAARAAVYGLWREGTQVVVVNRTLERAREMLTQLTFSAGIADVKALTLDEAVEWQPQIIINATSAGMYPHVDQSPWVSGVPFPSDAVLYDMVYRPAQTSLMHLAQASNSRPIGGLGMLVRQGAIAFKRWTGVDAPLDVMFNALHAHFNMSDE